MDCWWLPVTHVGVPTLLFLQIKQPTLVIADLSCVLQCYSVWKEIYLSWSVLIISVLAWCNFSLRSVYLHPWLLLYALKATSSIVFLQGQNICPLTSPQPSVMCLFFTSAGFLSGTIFVDWMKPVTQSEKCAAQFGLLIVKPWNALKIKNAPFVWSFPCIHAGQSTWMWVKWRKSDLEWYNVLVQINWH